MVGDTVVALYSPEMPLNMKQVHC